MPAGTEAIPIQGWALALRDLTEQGAERITARFPGGTKLTYRKGKGATALIRGKRIELTDDDLDYTGLMPVSDTEALLALARAATTKHRPEETR